MKKSLVLLLSLASTVAMAQSADLKVAIDPTYEPFTYKTPDGQPTGFDVDIANALCKQMKRKCVFVEQAWDAMIPGLQAKKYDTIISSMGITEDRMKVVDFTDKYYQTPSKIVVKNDVKFTGFESLKGKNIGVLKGSSQEKYANGDLKPLGVNVAQDQVYLDMRSGRLDGTVANIVEIASALLKKPEGKDFVGVGPDLVNPKYFGAAGIAVRKGETALKDELNAAIKAIRANGTYKSINDKYFSFDAYGAK
jgi:arginine/ornithine transport system substrate-binding protein